MLKSPRAEDLYVADAGEAAQLVLHLENGQIRQVQHVVNGCPEIPSAQP